MPISTTHTIAGGLAGLTFAALDKDKNGNSQHNPLAAIGVGTIAGKLPDIIEPSLGNPHHRQFFHSFLALASIGYATKKAYDWEPETKREAVARSIALFCVRVGSMSHLFLDAMTTRSLPLLGKI